MMVGCLHWGIAVLALVHPCVSGPVVHLTQGSIEGSRRVDGVDAFLGIPYAAPPLGPLRFEEASRPIAWKGVRDGTRFGAPCLQVPSGDPNEFPDPEAPIPNENCLFLNVWRPSIGNSSFVPAASKLPVLVWLHGGGFCAGTGSEKWFDGGRLASNAQKPHIVVTLNYRLGPLGFFVRDETGTGGANGINDQAAALRWLHENVEAFGGDPTRVTLFGQSAGGMSVCVLSVSPRARGLFRRAIVESGPCIDERGWGPGSAAEGRKYSKMILAAHNASGIDDLKTIRNASDIQWPDAAMNDFTFPGYFVDNDVMPEAPSARYAKAATADTLNVNELIVGMNSKDGTSQYYAQVPFVTNASNGNWSSDMLARWGADLAPEVMEHYDYRQPRFNGSIQAAFVQADSDFVVGCPSLRLSRMASAVHGAQVYSYQLSHYKRGIDVAGELAMIDEKDSIGWASHGADIPFVFGQHTGPDLYWNTKINVPFTPEEEDLSAAMRNYWTAFSATGMPAAHGWPVWPSFNASSARTINFETHALGGTGVLHALKEKDCAFWDRVGERVPRVWTGGAGWHGRRR